MAIVHLIVLFVQIVLGLLVSAIKDALALAGTGLLAVAIIAALGFLGLSGLGLVGLVRRRRTAHRLKSKTFRRNYNAAPTGNRGLFADSYGVGGGGVDAGGTGALDTGGAD